MLMDGDDVDSSLTESFQNVLELSLMHRYVAVDDRFVVAAGEGAPSVHAHLIADFDIMHPGRSTYRKFVHTVLVLALQTEGCIEFRGIQRRTGWIDLRVGISECLRASNVRELLLAR